MYEKDIQGWEGGARPGLSTWFGGTLFGQVSLNPASMVGATRKGSRCPNVSTAAHSFDPSLTLTRKQYSAMVSDTGNRRPFAYAGFANSCNAQQPQSAHS